MPAPASLPRDLGHNAPPQELVDACKVVVEAASRVYVLPNLDEQNRRWTLQREAFARIPLAYIDTPAHYARLMFLSDELEKLGAKNIARLTEEHVLRIGILLVTRQASDAMNISVQALAERMVMFTEQHPGRESSELIDHFLQQVRLMNADERDSRLAIIAPIFLNYFIKTQQTAKASALVGASENMYILYSQFGAVGDGVTDDFEAIVRAHATANELGLPVKADPGATYYIGGERTQPALIKTDTDWGDAKFIIDLSVVGILERPQDFPAVFSVPRTSAYTLNATQLAQFGLLAAGQEKVPIENVTGIQLDGDVFVRVQHNNAFGQGDHKIDFFRTNKNGNVDPTTPILHNFDTITHLSIYPIDKKTLTVKGGEFVVKKRAMTPDELATYTASNRYFAIGISVQRHKTVLDGIRYVRNEGELEGTRSIRFLEITYASNVTVQNCLFTAQIPVNSVGAYGISVWYSLDVLLLNCEQTQSITDGAFWGITTTGYTKNIVGDHVKFNRFPSHHTSNHSPIVRDSIIGVHASQTTGTGLFLIDNSTVLSGHMLVATDSWDGEIEIRNCNLHSSSSMPGVIFNQFAGKTNPFYKVPKVTIDGLHVIAPNSGNSTSGLSIYWANRLLEEHTYDAPDEIFVRNITRDNGTGADYGFRIGNVPSIHNSIKMIDLDKK